MNIENSVAVWLYKSIATRATEESCSFRYDGHSEPSSKVLEDEHSVSLSARAIDFTFGMITFSTGTHGMIIGEAFQDLVRYEDVLRELRRFVSEPLHRRRNHDSVAIPKTRMPRA